MINDDQWDLVMSLVTKALKRVCIWLIPICEGCHQYAAHPPSYVLHLYFWFYRYFLATLVALHFTSVSE